MASSSHSMDGVTGKQDAKQDAECGRRYFPSNPQFPFHVLFAFPYDVPVPIKNQWIGGKRCRFGTTEANSAATEPQNVCRRVAFLAVSIGMCHCFTHPVLQIVLRNIQATTESTCYSSPDSIASTLPPKILDWVAVEELKLSYHIGETLLLFTIYTHSGNLI